MNPITHLLPEKLVTALGWTLLHSLWQGALIALLAGVALILLKKHSAAVRYCVTLTALATIFLLAVVTFLGRYGAAPEPAAAPAVAYAPAPVSTATVGATGSVLPASLTKGFAGYFAGHFPLVVLGWAAGVLVLLLRLVGGLAYAARMKSYQVTAAATPWQEKTAGLAERLGLRRKVRLLESGLAKVPMTIGYLKPVILLPFGALAGLTPGQVEAVLAHELAHIRRHDYLVNLAQSLLEILMFYHPAVWWLSARVREEREHCCDDLAVALCSDSMTFARALVHLEEQYGQAPALALAANGRDGMLMGRIKRLLVPGRRTPTFVDGFIVALVLLAGVGVVSVSAAARLHAPKSNLNVPVTNKSAAPVRKSAGELAAGRTAHYLQWADSTDRRSDVIIVKDKKGNIIELYVDGRRIPDKEVANYRRRIDQALAEQNRNRYSDAPDRDVNRAFRRMEGRNGDGSSWNISGDLNVFPPLPPLPPMEPMPAVPPMEPMPPIEPVPPMEPMPGMDFGGHFFDGDEDYAEGLREELQHLEEEYQQQREDGKAQMERLQQEFESDLESDEDGKVRAELEKRQLDLRQRLEKMEESYRRSRKLLKGRIDQAERSGRRPEKARGQTEKMLEDMAHYMSEQAERMKQQTAHLQEHMAQIKVHSGQMKKHTDFMQVLNAHLEADGFLKENAAVDFEMKKGQLYINGRVQPDEVYRKYLKLFEAQDQDVFSKEPGGKDFAFRLQHGG